MSTAIITLTTDFGLADPYVGALKGAILSVNPEATIVDITHEVRPQRVDQAAFILASAYPYFPPGAIHVAVVDPGVGTERRAIALATPRAIFVGPDNGVLSAALPDEVREAASTGARLVPLRQPFTAHALTERGFHRHPVSPTFHGRDIFAPVAAHLSLGVALEEFGPPVAEIVALPPFRAGLQADGSLAGRVRHVDRFGNLITDIRAEQLPAPAVQVEICGRRIEGLSQTYGDRPGLLAVSGSSGFLEIAFSQGSAAHELATDIGQPVLVRPLR